MTKDEEKQMKTKATKSDEAAWLPGRKGVYEVLHHKPQRIHTLYLRKGVQLESEFQALIEELSAQASLPIVTLDRMEFEALGLGGSTQGVAAKLQTLPEQSEQSLIDRLIETEGLLVICDQISDPQNLGAILRVAESAGAVGVILTKDRSASLTTAVRKAAAGASELLPVITTKNLQRTLERLKKQGVWILGTALSAESRPLYSAPRLRPAALILGSEGEGMRRISMDSCDVLLEIPMRGAIQSLNVSQAASVVLYELTSPERALE